MQRVYLILTFSGTTSVIHTYWNNECFLCSLFKGIFREPLCIFCQNICKLTSLKSIHWDIKNVLNHLIRIEPSKYFVSWSDISNIADFIYLFIIFEEEVWYFFISWWMYLVVDCYEIGGVAFQLHSG